MREKCPNFRPRNPVFLHKHFRMNISLLSFLTLTPLFLLFQLSCTQKTTDGIGASSPGDTTGVAWTLMYDRGPCYGFCPIYTFYLTDQSHGLIEAKGHLPDTGWFVTTLNKGQVSRILKVLDDEKFWHPDFRDQPEISDLPSHHLIYLHPSGVREIRIHSRITEELSEFFQNLNQLITNAKRDSTTMRPNYFEAQKNIIIQLKGGVEAKAWIDRYAYMGAYIVKQIAPNQRYYLVSKKSNTYTFPEFFEALKTDEELTGVEWDKETVKRKE